MAEQQIIWLEARCPICKMLFKYPYDGYYTPKTCSNWDCIYKYQHMKAHERIEAMKTEGKS